MPPLEGFWNYGKQFVQSWTGTGDKSGERAHDSVGLRLRQHSQETSN